MMKRNDSPLVDLMPRSDESLYPIVDRPPPEAWGLIVDCSDSGQFSRFSPFQPLDSASLALGNEQEAQEKRAFARGSREENGRAGKLRERAINRRPATGEGLHPSKM